MKLMTLLSSRSDIIKLSLLIKVLDQHCEHILVHTGEESDESLCDLHFRDLEIRAPDIDLRNSGNDLTSTLESVAPDRVLTTNSLSEKVGSIVYFIGHSHPPAAADVAMLYSTIGREAAIRTGFDPPKAIAVGHPLSEVLDTFSERIEASGVINALSVRPFEYFLATIHQDENIGQPADLSRVMNSLEAVASRFGKTVLVTVHPRTAKQIEAFQIKPSTRIRLLRSMSFFDFVKLEKNALAVLTDSSGVQDECCMLRAPVVTLSRNVTRPETIACGSNIIAGDGIEGVLRAVELAIGQPAAWEPPAEYRLPNVSQTVSRILLGEVFG